MIERLLFLDSTLERMIQRFEDEYPETRINSPASANDDDFGADSLPSLIANLPDHEDAFDSNEASNEGMVATDDDERTVRMPISRHDSDVNLASRRLGQEEGRLHRFGQQIRRDILRPLEQDYQHGTTGSEVDQPHIQKLRQTLEGLKGEEIKEAVEARGAAAVLKELGATAEELLVLQQQDPEGFEKFREAQLIAQHNMGRQRNSGHEVGA